MTKYIFNKKGLKKIDRVKELGNKICRFTECYEKGRGRIYELAALVDVLFCIREIFKSYDKKSERLEEYLKDKDRIEELELLKKENKKSLTISALN